MAAKPCTEVGLDCNDPSKITNEELYSSKVAEEITAGSTHEATAGQSDEVWVKVRGAGSSDASQHFDVAISSGGVWANEVAICSPPKF